MSFMEQAICTYRPFPGLTRDLRLGTGTATSGTYDGREYVYINAMSDIGAAESGNIYVGTVYLKPNMSYTTGTLDFYFEGANNNTDDSNVSSGIDISTEGVYTQYEDALYAVYNTGAYTFSTGYGCPFRPYATDVRYTSTLGSPLGSANSFTGLMDTGVVLIP